MRHKTNTKWGWGLFQKTLSQSHNADSPIGGLGTGMRTGWGLYLKDRNGLGMQWSNRPRKRVGWGICIRLNSPPKILNMRSMIFLWSFIWKEGRTLLSKATGRNTRYSQFYKYLSLRIIIKGAINYVRRNEAHRDCPQMGDRYYENKGLVCSLLGNGIWCWSFNSSTLH